MGETGDPRFSELLNLLVHDPSSMTRKPAVAALERLQVQAAAEEQRTPCRIVAHLLPHHERKRRAAVAIDTSNPLLPTHFRITEDGLSVARYTVTEHPPPEACSVVFLISLDGPAAAWWVDMALTCLAGKRPADTWACIAYRPTMREGGERRTGPPAFEKAPEAIIARFKGSASQAEVTTDLYRSLWRAVRSSGPFPGPRKIVVLHSGENGGSAGPDLIQALHSTRANVQAVSAGPHEALESLCRQTGGHFAGADNPAALAELVANAYLSLFPRYEVAWEPVRAEASSVRVSVRSPLVCGEAPVDHSVTSSKPVAPVSAR